MPHGPGGRRTCAACCGSRAACREFTAWPSAPGGASWRQSTFHPFALTAWHARGTVLRTEGTGPRIDTRKYGEMDALDSVTTWDEESGALTVLAVNRDQAQPLTLRAALRGLPSGYRVAGRLAIADADPDAVNSESEPNRVIPRPVEGSRVTADGELEAAAPPLSWNMIRLLPVTGAQVSEGPPTYPGRTGAAGPARVRPGPPGTRVRRGAPGSCARGFRGAHSAGR
ncbi:hypothetical protein LHJ74_05950 [Streptomyces sp. N2-109]|uniref:Alpha-L-arabinofuranosidase C-terminal domain-containing protein n=1 Tax=Streptomyces gossypii TaxID=2883101 RepID=A0ABT2JPM1_9ACTN|nr:hypothetical protein [Streptomyces gossypii]